MALFTYLRDNMKLLTPDSQLLKFHIEEYHSDSYIARTTRQELEEQLPACIELLYTYDLGKAIDAYSRTRWSSLHEKGGHQATIYDDSKDGA